MAILLIRHGETAANAARILQTPEVALSERGIAQAERLAERLAGMPLAAILSSDLVRAAQTADRIAAASGLPVEPEPLLQERHFGSLRGTPYAELGGDPFAADFAPPGGETWERFHQRVERAWARVVERAAGLSGDLAVVTHGLVCRAVIRSHARWPETPSDGLGPVDPVRREPAIANTSLTVLGVRPPHWLSLVACTRHLDGPGDGDAGAQGAGRGGGGGIA